MKELEDEILAMNPFKRFCISFIVLLCLAFFVIKPILFYVSLGVQDAPGRTIDNWFKIKEGHAKNSSGKKIFVLGHSTTLFGVDTSLMEQELGITSVNFGIAASMRDYVPERLEALLGSGDILLIPWEYHSYGGDELGTEFYVYILEYDPDYFARLSMIEKIAFIHNTDLIFLVKRIFARTFTNDYGDDADYWISSKNLNQNGDLTNNIGRKYIKPYIPPEKNFSDGEAVSDVIRSILGDLASYCHDRNVNIYAIWPPYYPPTEKKEFYGHDAKVVDAIKRFWSSVGVSVLGDYRNSLVDFEDCYDGPGHLNEIGRKKYTQYLIELIRPYITKTPGQN